MFRLCLSRAPLVFFLLCPFVLLVRPSGAPLVCTSRVPFLCALVGLLVTPFVYLGVLEEYAYVQGHYAWCMHFVFNQHAS